jgi:hypothetical protein
MEALRAAEAGVYFSDPDAERYFAPDRAPTLGSTFFSNPSEASVWRAMALGAEEYRDIADLVRLAPGTIKNNMTSAMCNKLRGYTGQENRSKATLRELVGFARENKVFLLDEAVRLRYPLNRH